MDDKKYKSIHDIQGTTVNRLSTGLSELDWVYGSTDNVFGIPEKSISLWSGPSGTGKSRLAIQVIKSLFSIDKNYKVLYFQGEVPLENFASYVGADPETHRNLYVSDFFDMFSMEEIIKELRPHIIFIDSVNKVEDFKKHGGDYIIDGDSDNNLLGFKALCNKYDCILCMLGQVNQDGSNKGGTSLTHAVDVHLSFSPILEDKNRFKIEIGEKNRYGKKAGVWAIFEHDESGVHEVTTNRFYDEDWCKKKGKERFLTEEELEEDMQRLKKCWEELQKSEEEIKKNEESCSLDSLSGISDYLGSSQNRQKTRSKNTYNQPQKEGRKDMSIEEVRETMRKCKGFDPNTLPNPKRGFLGRMRRAAYLNYMYGQRPNRDYSRMYANGDLELNDYWEIAERELDNVAARHIASNTNLADKIASNQEALLEHTISQGMTWLYPRFENKLDEISQKIKKD